MRREVLARYEADRRGTVDVMNIDGDHLLVMNSPCGETTIYFDEVNLGRTITFYQSHGYESKGHMKVGSIEGPCEEYGEVGEWLREYAEENTPPTYKL